MCNLQQSADNDPKALTGVQLTGIVWKLIQIWTGRVLLVLGLAFLAGYTAARIEGWAGERMFLRKFATAESPAASMFAERGSSNESSSPGKLPRALSGATLGVLEIPRIGLRAPLLEGTDDLTMNHAVGRIQGTAFPGASGDIGIAGHRDGIFRELRNVKRGDIIELKTLNGKDIYAVDQLRIVNPDDVSVLRPRSKPSLTLVTCYPFCFVGSAPKRFIVQAFLTQPTSTGRPSEDGHTAGTTQVTHKEKQ
jgi:sortase A